MPKLPENIHDVIINEIVYMYGYVRNKNGKLWHKGNMSV